MFDARPSVINCDLIAFLVAFAMTVSLVAEDTVDEYPLRDSSLFTAEIISLISTVLITEPDTIFAPRLL